MRGWTVKKYSTRLSQKWKDGARWVGRRGNQDLVLWIMQEHCIFPLSHLSNSSFFSSPFHISHREPSHSLSLVYRSLAALRREGATQGPLIPFLASVVKEKITSSPDLQCTPSTFHHIVETNVQRLTSFFCAVTRSRLWTPIPQHNQSTIHPAMTHVSTHKFPMRQSFEIPLIKCLPKH